MYGADDASDIWVFSSFKEGWNNRKRAETNRVRDLTAVNQKKKKYELPQHHWSQKKSWFIYKPGYYDGES